MAQLTNDQIKWTLILDAKGVQGTINALSSDIRKLEQDNRALSGAILATEKELAENEKAMKKLADACKSESSEYKNLEENSRQLKSNIKDLRSEIEANTKAIDNHKKAISDNLKEMSLSDMTMQQLKERAAELKAQLEVTSLHASSSEYKKLQKELSATEQQMVTFGNKNKSLLSQFAAAPGPIGAVGKSVQGLSISFKALIANPVGILIMAIVAAFMLLKNALEGNKDMMTQFNAILNFGVSIFDSLKRIATEYIMILKSLLTFDFEGVKQHSIALKENATAMLDNAAAAYESAAAERLLEEQTAKNNDTISINSARIAELRTISQDVTKSLKERQSASNEANLLEKENYAQQVQNITGAYNLFKSKNQNLIDAMKRGSSEQFAELEKYMQMAQSGTELTFEQRKRMNGLIHDITSSLNEGTDEQKQIFRGFFSSLTATQTDYFKTSRENSNENARIRKENAQKAFEAAEKRIVAASEKEQYLLKKSRLENNTTESEESKKLLFIKQDELQKKLELYKKSGKDITRILSEIDDTKLTLQKLEINQELKNHDDGQKKEALMLGEEYLAKRLTEEEFQSALANLAKVNAEKKLEILKKHGLDTMDAQKALQDEEIKLRDKADKAKEKADKEKIKNLILDYKQQDKLLKEQQEEKLLKQGKELKSGNLLQYQYDNEVLEINKKFADQRLGLALSTSQKIAKMAADNVSGAKEMAGELEGTVADMENKSTEATEEFVENFKRDMAGLADAIYNMDIGEAMEGFQGVFVKTFAAIDTLFADMGYTWQDKSKAIIGVISSGLSAAAQYSKMYFELETQALEAEKQKQLTIAGDSAEERERIEQEFAEKELELKKKQANVDAGIQIAQAFAQLALGIITIWSTCMQAGPFAGPIIAGILSAAMVATTGIQVAMIEKQRQVIANSTLGGTSSSSAATSAVPTGERILNSGGYADGGYTGDGGKYEVAGYMPSGEPYHKGEYFVAQEEMRNPMIAPLVRAIEAVRRKRTANNPLPATFAGGYADGGYTQSSGNSQTEIGKAIADFIKVLKEFKSSKIKAEVNYFEFEAAGTDINNIRNRKRKR